jgi:hypothetical protein
MHERVDSGSVKFSPSLRAISRIDRRIMMVETGSSNGSEKYQTPRQRHPKQLLTLCVVAVNFLEAHSEL